jgi:predicted phage gp36 major capsid-like protein
VGNALASELASALENAPANSLAVGVAAMMMSVVFSNVDEVVVIAGVVEMNVAVALQRLFVVATFAKRLKRLKRLKRRLLVDSAEVRISVEACPTSSSSGAASTASSSIDFGTTKHGAIAGAIAGAIETSMESSRPGAHSSPRASGDQVRCLVSS